MEPSRPLFRHEAVEFHERQRQWGDVAALQPLSAKLTAWFLIASTATVILFLFLGQYARKETAVGYLTPTSGTAKIFVSRGGTIKAVHVKEGEKVAEGQPLLTIDTYEIAEDGVDINASVLSTLASQKNLLAKNIAAEEHRTDSERERLTKLVEGLQDEIAQLSTQIDLQSKRIEVAESDLDAAERLRSKGFTTAVELKRRQAEMLAQKQSLSALQQQLAARQNQLTETQFTLQQLPTVMAQKVQAFRNELAITEQRIAYARGRRAYVVRAPNTGQVSTLQSKVGQHADPQRLQLEIIPEEAVLEAELYLPARAIGFVQPGQTVRLLYDAFPYQHFGTYSGKVIKISQTILTEKNAAGPIVLKEPAYRVRASLDRQHIDAHGTQVSLQPDMLLKADIILEKRSLLKWLISPLTGLRM